MLQPKTTTTDGDQEARTGSPLISSILQGLLAVLTAGSVANAFLFTKHPGKTTSMSRLNPLTTGKYMPFSKSKYFVIQNRGCSPKGVAGHVKQKQDKKRNSNQKQRADNLISRTCPSRRISAPKNQSSSGGMRAAIECTSSRNFSPRDRNFAAKYSKPRGKYIRRLHSHPLKYNCLNMP